MTQLRPPRKRKAPPAKKQAGNKLFKLAVGVLILSGVALGVLLLPWRSHTDQLSSFFVQQSGRMGLRAQHVLVGGRYLTRPDDVLMALGVDRNDPLLALDLPAMQDRLQSLPFVAHAGLRRQWPHTLVVVLRERIPAARWRAPNGITQLLDMTGVVIPGVASENFQTLPLITGAEAASQVGQLLQAWRQYPALRDQLAEADWVGGRRFDLKLKNGVIIKLPEGELSHGLAQLSELVVTHQLLDRPVATIDMRVDGRLVLQKQPATPEEKTTSPAQNTSAENTSTQNSSDAPETSATMNASSDSSVRPSIRPSIRPSAPAGETSGSTLSTP